MEDPILYLNVKLLLIPFFIGGMTAILGAIFYIPDCITKGVDTLPTIKLGILLVIVSGVLMYLSGGWNGPHITGVS